MKTSDESELLVKLGNRIRKLRVERGFSQTELANIIGKDQPSINRIEQGKINPGYLILQQIADGIGVSIQNFFD